MTRFKTVLNLSCPNQPGIVAKVAQHLFDQGCDIREAQQFDDAATGRFFMRVVSAAEAESGSPEALRTSFAPLAERFSMDWAVHDALRRRRVMILVSKFDHCLADLLYRWRRLGLFQHQAWGTWLHAESAVPFRLDLWLRHLCRWKESGPR